MNGTVYRSHMNLRIRYQRMTMKAPTPEAVAAAIAMLFGVLDPFLTRLGEWMTLHWSIVFQPDYVQGRLVPFVTAVATYWFVQKARQWHEGA